jgi:hypothetical protein
MALALPRGPRLETNEESIKQFSHTSVPSFAAVELSVLFILDVSNCDFQSTQAALFWLEYS